MLVAVSTEPGRMAFTRTWGASSLASVLVMLFTPALAAPLAPMPRDGIWDSRLDMLMIDPCSTSQAAAMALRPVSRTLAAVASIWSAVRAVHTMSAPASANPRAIPWPMPLPAPVMMATLPL